MVSRLDPDSHPELDRTDQTAQTDTDEHRGSVDWASYLDESRDYRLHSLVDDLEAVGIVQTHDVGPHEGKDGHDVVEDFLLQDGTNGGNVFS